MTVNKYYFIYGFKVPIPEYAAMHGYGRELLNDDRFISHVMNLNHGFYTGYGDNDPDDQLQNIATNFDAIVQDIMAEGVEFINDSNPHWDAHGYSSMKSFTLNGSTFVTRSATHDNTLNDYYIVGVDRGSVTNSRGGISDVGSVFIKCMSNRQLDDATLIMISSRLTTTGIPLDIILMITKYLYSPDYRQCDILLTDPKWSTIIHPEHNPHLEPQLIVLTDDCSCCS
jgi:hypothetical protein